ncbi:hypothetical protein [Aquimarina agarivorans]|uniref:hypothetical protein n=1 Tax=Aquimarina agarivorans TaxID=980584 RepID=UPI000248E9AE|nr:hypothetical protein [Aquimarina agarivorans]
MKKSISIISFVLVAFFANAQSNYEKGMQKAFGLWQENKIEEASNLFERIANAEKENWLPYYYVANVNVTINPTAINRDFMLRILYPYG